MPISTTVSGMTKEEFLSELATFAPLMGSTALTPVTTTAAVAQKPQTAAERKKAEKEAARQISDGGEHTDPKDTAETDKQDGADEAADKTKGEPEKLTADSIRTALGAYVKKFGMPAAQEDGPKVITLALGARDPKDATVNWKISDIPDNQESLKKVLDGVTEMTAKNPFKREAVKA